MCLNPKILKKTGKYKEDNYRGQAGEKYSISTFTECGSCPQCIAKRANNWVVRNYFEAKKHKRKCFITLTYAKQPFFLVRKDIQDFMKRFRHEINKEYFKAQKYAKKHYSDRVYSLWKQIHEKDYIKTRMFYVMEYGTLHGRPHAHIIIYGWDDEKAYFIGINKKINVIYQSETIQKTWNLGKTTYQSFGDHEAPYISLYSTPQEAFKRAYKLTREKIKQISEIVNRKIDYYSKGQRINLLNALSEAEKQLNEEKKKYLLIKEFNGWSMSMGWDGFIEEYTENNVHTFDHAIFTAILATPSPWLKKLANQYGDIAAAQELFRRETEMPKNKTELEEQGKMEAREKTKRKKEVIEWNEGRKNNEIEAF